MAVIPEEHNLEIPCERSEEAISEEDTNANEGWADAMSKVLGRLGSKDVSTVILAKSKLDHEDKEDIKEKRKRQKRVKTKRKWESMNYTKPNVLEKDYERALQKTATRGVIQLFNAVKKHQTNMEEKLKKAKTESRKEKAYKSVNKGKFLDMLDGGKASKDLNTTLTEEKEEAPSWKVLRDDFMLGNDMKDWDRKSDDDDDDTDTENAKT